MGLYSGGLISRRIVASEINLGAYIQEGLFLEGLIVRISRYRSSIKAEIFTEQFLPAAIQHL